ncbi:MAG: FkbM family methyltransferase [Minwuia sp.]|uniref:FkbM family methyltransferase n=1 Tax=Minwuia sp. TaxID=2493630 RepID=UPI003A83FD84
MIRRLKRALGIHFSSKALVRNPDIAWRQYLGRFRSFAELASELASTRPVTLVQVGANDGSANDPLARMIAEDPERIDRALLIEPQTAAFERLTARYRGFGEIHCLNAAIDREAGERTIWSIDRDAVKARLGRNMSDGIASFERDHVIQVLRQNGIGDAETFLTSEPVTLSTLGGAAASVSIRDPDILLIDTEGFDAEILRMALDTGWRPRLLQYEHKHLSTPDRRAVSARLRALGYRLWADHADAWGRLEGQSD